MRAVVFHQHGDEGVLQLTEFPEPTVSARHVLVRVKAVALNHLDLWTRQGWPGLKLELPHILGSDIGDGPGARRRGADQPGHSSATSSSCPS